MKSWQSDLYELVYKSEITLQTITHVHAIVRKNVPRELFKFMCLNSSYTNVSLTNGTQFFNQPKNFNDFYDASFFYDHGDQFIKSKTLEFLEKIYGVKICDVIPAGLDISGPLFDKDWRIILERVVGRTYSVRETKDFISHNAKQFEGIRDRSLAKFLDLVRSRVLVTCLSDRVDSQLMWAHYGSSHTGIAVSYDFGDSEVFDKFPHFMMPVFYSESLYDASSDILGYLEGIRGGEAFFPIRPVFKKSKDWSYENEWRIIELDPTCESGRSIQMPSPKAFYLGEKLATVIEKK